MRSIPLKNSLSEYVATQLNSFFPTGPKVIASELDEIVKNALLRFEKISTKVNCFTNNDLNELNTLQYATFLYLLSNEEYKSNGASILADKLFYLNKMLNSIEIFYKVKLPPVFFISHGVGTVLGDAIYGDNLVVFQNVTVGRVGNKSPVIGDNVILYPGSVVSGESLIGNNCIISANTVVSNKIIPSNSIVFNSGTEIVCTLSNRSYIELYIN